jgi:hypothetical protein
VLVKGKINERGLEVDLDLKELCETSYKRRQNLIREMNQLEKAEVTCRNCPGTCCTFVGNSMQPTVLEAIDLYLYLKENNIWNDELVKKLEGCIEDFRLHIRPSTGRGVYMRKSYTCPFFGHQSLGCPIPPEAKPYGCLGFNASEREEDSGKSCSSNLSVLKEREGLYKMRFHSEGEEVELSEEEISKLLQESLGLPWHKESIPVALLDLDRVWPRS